MTATQKITLSALCVLACISLALVGYVGAQTYGAWAQQPLGPSLPTSAYTPLGLPPTWTASPAVSPVSALSLVTRTARPTLRAFPTITPYSAARCGGPPVMTLLVIGTDSRTDSYTYGLADVIRVVRVDFITPRVTVLEFPRDLWVEIPEIVDDIGQDHEKLNQAYLYGNPGFDYYDDPSRGPGLLSRTLDLNFGVKADHYLAVNMRTFVKIVDAVDGIDVTLPETVDGRTADSNRKSLIFEAGTHHLDGARALALARVRTEGVFERAENQNKVLCALRDKLVSPTTITKIPRLINSFQGAVQTDLSPEIIAQLSCLGTQLPVRNIIFASFPQELFEGARIYDPVFKKNLFVWNVDFKALHDYVAWFNRGTWPVSAPGAPETDTTSYCP